MRPAKGLPWDTLAHRKADALVDLCRSYADVQPTGRFKFEIVNITHTDASEPRAEVAGIPLAQEQIIALLPNAKVRDAMVDENGLTTTVRKPRKALPADVERHVLRRDLHCRVPGCTSPVHQIHHMYPVCDFGDTTDVHQLAGVCSTDHRILVPNGKYWLIGDAEQHDGLRLVHRDDLAANESRDGPSP